MKIKIKIQNGSKFLPFKEFDMDVDKKTMIHDNICRDEFYDHSNPNLRFENSLINKILFNVLDCKIVWFDLMYKGKVIRKLNQSLEDLGVKEGDVLHLLVRINQLNTSIFSIRSYIQFTYPKDKETDVDLNTHIKIKWTDLIAINSNIFKNYFAIKNSIKETSFQKLILLEGRCYLAKIMENNRVEYENHDNIIDDIRETKITIKDKNFQNVIYQTTPKFSSCMDIIVDPLNCLKYDTEYEVNVSHPDNLINLFLKSVSFTFRTKNFDTNRYKIELHI